jgi:hypothetical protein
MGSAAIAALLLFTDGVTPWSLGTSLLACTLTMLSVLIFGRRS